MGRFALSPGEAIRKQEMGLIIKGKMRGYPGQLVLTNHRLVFQRTLNPLLGLIGLLIPAMRGDTDLDLPFGDIASVTRGTHGRNDKVLVITPRDGDPAKVVLSKTIDEWVSAVTEAI